MTGMVTFTSTQVLLCRCIAATGSDSRADSPLEVSTAGVSEQLKALHDNVTGKGPSKLAGLKNSALTKLPFGQSHNSVSGEICHRYD